MATRNEKGLGSSIWASRGSSYSSLRSRSVPPAAAAPNLHNPTTTTTRLRAAAAPTGDLTPAQALHRFEQTCKRLRWKMIDLFQSLERASAPEQWGFEPEEAEMNFKVDFHEAYVWIEQALVFLQLVFGVVIPRGNGGVVGMTNGSIGKPATHAYHHNVLQALADASSPLYATLGKGDVKEALWKAKELRNRWKDAAVASGAGDKDTPPRQMYSVDWIVKTIMLGLEQAYPLARQRVSEEREKVNGAEEGEVRTEEKEEEGWNWMMEDGDTEMMDV
ncbi:hypothetical protein NLU13_1516 [Sarocladium strictum]|uniref:Uncharacterized protein n=1 Tax=Sarocladium strictum TaxID=5046 RepID=A0AA39GR44_SARSR|nr:hypothetical protein NLU13_1516 [Sarocladium strictum]